MQQPINKGLANDYRTTLGVSDAPSFIETEIPVTPVAVINNGLPRPSSNQKFRYVTINTGVDLRQFQVSTASSTTRIYYLGYCLATTAAVAQVWEIFDATSGANPALADNTAYNDNLGNIQKISIPAALTTLVNYLPLPLEVKNGIRVQQNAAVGADAILIIFFLEESVN